MQKFFDWTCSLEPATVPKDPVRIRCFQWPWRLKHPFRTSWHSAASTALVCMRMMSGIHPPSAGKKIFLAAILVQSSLVPVLGNSGVCPERICLCFSSFGGIALRDRSVGLGLSSDLGAGARLNTDLANQAHVAELAQL